MTKNRKYESRKKKWWVVGGPSCSRSTTAVFDPSARWSSGPRPPVVSEAVGRGVARLYKDRIRQGGRQHREIIRGFVDPTRNKKSGVFRRSAKASYRGCAGKLAWRMNDAEIPSKETAFIDTPAVSSDVGNRIWPGLSRTDARQSREKPFAFRSQAGRIGACA